MSLYGSNNVTYRVVGRYMNGSTVTGYHLVGSDGSQLPQVTKERLVYMIGKGLVENMRVQAYNGEIILRGKGINLNNLPVYDEKYNKFRGEGDVGCVNKVGSMAMGQFKIVKRIMYKTSCIGYVVVDGTGKEYKLSREKVLELGKGRLLVNATVQKYRDANGIRLILRGINCNLNELPVVLVDEQGHVIDPEKDKNKLRLRAAKMKRGGILYDTVKNIKLAFEPGDYLVCGANGVLRVMKESEFMNKFKADLESKTAICDNYLDNLSKYPIEIFGTTARALDPNIVKNWAIVVPKVKESVRQ